MRILIDQDILPNGSLGAAHYFHSESSAGMISMPSQTAQLSPPITPIAFIGMMNGNPSMQQACGWSVVSQLPGETEPMTRWQRLVAHTNSVQGDPQLVALNLK